MAENRIGLKSISELLRMNFLYRVTNEGIDGPSNK